MTIRHLSRAAAVAAMLMSCSITTVMAAPELIANGNFETTTATSSQQITTSNISSWSSTGYNFIFLADMNSGSGSTADTTGASGKYGNVRLWGPGDGSTNGLIKSPVGGNFIAADNNFEQGAITQTVAGLAIGQAYSLSFWWAAAQQYGFSGENQEQWQVTFGSQTQSTNVVDLASHAFSGWTQVTMNFVASATSQTLSFLAVGAPNGNPPFSLLDGVSLMATVSEPDSWMVMLAGAICLAAWSLTRNRRVGYQP